MMKKKKRMEGMGLGINITPKKYKAYLLRKVDSQASVFHILLLHHIHLSHTTYQKNVKMSNVVIKLCLNNGKILQGRRKNKNILFQLMQMGGQERYFFAQVLCRV
jgi:hypothetical protein